MKNLKCLLSALALIICSVSYTFSQSLPNGNYVIKYGDKYLYPSSDGKIILGSNMYKWQLTSQPNGNGVVYTIQGQSKYLTAVKFQNNSGCPITMEDEMSEHRQKWTIGNPINGLRYIQTVDGRQAISMVQPYGNGGSPAKTYAYTCFGENTSDICGNPQFNTFWNQMLTIKKI
mgnify:CR=1 FL=1